MSTRAELERAETDTLRALDKAAEELAALEERIAGLRTALKEIRTQLRALND